MMARAKGTTDCGDGRRPRAPEAAVPRRVLLVCAGLDHAHRGFETFARECFTALRGRSDIEIELVKGSGPQAVGERAVPTLRRGTPAARLLGRVLRGRPFVVEHVAFSLALIPLLAKRRPDVIFFSEWHVGRVLALWRKLSGQGFALVLSNGALAPGGYEHLDRVQQLVPGAIEYTRARGEPTGRQVLLPLALTIQPTLSPLGEAERSQLRERLGLPPGRRVVLSAGAITAQKRIDYVIKEIASMSAPRPFLVVAGQQEADAPPLHRLARDLLGSEGYDIRTVPPAAMPDLYRASDAFVLASVWESFARVLVEAQSHGLPCLAHAYPVMDWVLGEEGDTADLREPGKVASWLRGLTAADFSHDRRVHRHRSAYERFSWDTLADRYVEMLRAAAEERRRRDAVR